jgi:CheY-like chemotaxis protein
MSAPRQIEKLLIVDDHAQTRQWLRASLSTVAREIYESTDGTEAVQAYAEQRPDCVVMDIEMRPMDGLTATRLIVEKFPDARIIIATGHATESLRAAAEAAGAVHFLAKENLWQVPRFITEHYT